MSILIRTALSILVVACFSFAFNMKTFAEEHLDLEKYNIQELENGIYYDEDKGLKFNKIYNVSGGVLTEKSIEEYIEDKEETKLALKEDAQNDSMIAKKYNYPNHSIGTLAYGTSYVYKETSNRKVLIFGGRASIPVKCPTTNCNQSIGYSYTQTAQYSQNFSTSALKVLHAGVGFTWSISESVNSSSRMDIPKGFQGYWHFTPLMNRSDGNLYEYNDVILVRTIPTREYFPAKLNNQLDGELLAVVEKIPIGN